MIIMTAEFVPSGKDVESQVSRMFVVQINPEDTFVPLHEIPADIAEQFPKKTAAKIFEALAYRGDFNLAMSGYLRWIAQVMVDTYEAECKDKDRYTPISYFREVYLEQIVRSLDSYFSGDKPRLKENTMTYIIGWSLWALYLKDRGIFTEEEARQSISEFNQGFSELKRYYKKVITNPELFGARAMINSIKNMINIAGEAALVDRKDPEANRFAKPNCRIIGKVLYKGNVKTGIVLDPLLTSMALHCSEDEVMQSLSSARGVNLGYQFRSPSQDGDGRKQDRLRGIFIPMETWWSAESDMPDVDEEDESEGDDQWMIDQIESGLVLPNTSKK
jgi:hypothetical protein